MSVDKEEKLCNDSAGALQHFEVKEVRRSCKDMKKE